MSKHTTSELAAAAVGGRYDLVLIAANRVREMRLRQAQPLVEKQGSDISTALLEIEQGHVGRDYLQRDVDDRSRK